MLHHIIRFSIRRKLVVMLGVLMLIIAGITALSKLPIDALPDITSNQVQIITVSPSLAATEVERLITFPLEQAATTIPGITEMRSLSRFGLSVITVVFNDETDLYWARQQVAEKMSAIRQEIPPEAGTPDLAPATTGLGEVYQYVVKPKKGYAGKYTLEELRTIQDWIIRRQLLGTPGVADISSFGGHLKQYEVAVKPDRLHAMQVTLSDLFNALQKNNQNDGGAYIEKGPGALFIRSEGLATKMEDIQNIFVKHTQQGIPVFVKDVAEVRIGHAVRYGAMTYKDEGEVAGAVVLMLKGANGAKVVNDVKSRLAVIANSLPEGVEIESFYDRTKMVNNAIKTVKTNLTEGALIVLIVLIVFLGNWRAGVIVASVIPLAMLFAVILMVQFGVSGNLMSLGALDFGLIVDGAVIIVEAVLLAIYHNTSGKITKLTQAEMDAEVEHAAVKMMNAAVFGQMIILIVYLPILSLTGIEGKMFKPMAQTVSFALIGAFVLSLTYVPMMIALLMSKRLGSDKKDFSEKWMNWVQAKFKPILQKSLTIPRTIILAAIVLFSLAAFLMSTLGGEFIPELEEGDFAVDARLLTGSSLTETIKSTQQAVKILQDTYPTEVDKIVTRIGASEIPTDPMPMEMTDIMISLKPRKEWTSAKSFDELAEKMRTSLEDVPGLTAGFQYPVQMRFNELISGARQDVVCKIFGEHLDSLSSFAAQLAQIVRSVEGATDVYVEAVTGLPQIVVNYDRAAMASYRLHIEDVNTLIRAAFAGAAAGVVYENERKFDLVVRLANDERTSMKNVENLLIPLDGGGQVPLSVVADVSIQNGPNQIQRENAQRRIIVGFNTVNRDVASIVHELQNLIEQRMKLPAGYYIQYGGQFENLTEAKARLTIAVPVALLLIFMLLYFAFGSVIHGLLIFTAIPLSSIGGIVFLYLRQMPFSISAGIGFIALFGVAVLNGIVLLSEFRSLQATSSQNLNSIIIHGTLRRLRPVLMTASVASLGFLPMALSTGSGAEVQRPLATVVIGGLLSATILTLIVLPVLFYLVEKRKEKKRRVFPAMICIIVLLGSISNAYTQTPKSLGEVIKESSVANLDVQALKKGIEYWEVLQSQVYAPAPTQFGSEWGGVSSAKFDTRFYLNQELPLPGLASRQKKWYQNAAFAQKKVAEWKEIELHAAVKSVFYEMVINLERQKVLETLDSIYQKFQQASSIRFISGETNALEKTAADVAAQQLHLQLEQNLEDNKILQARMNALLNTELAMVPTYTDAKLPLVVDESLSTTHPELLAAKARQEVAKAQTTVEKAALLPDVSIGYGNQSLVGYQSHNGIDNIYYGPGDRFHTAAFSLSVPLFTGVIKTRIRANKIQEMITGLQVQQTIVSRNALWNEALNSQKKQHLAITYFENTGLSQANLMIKNASLSYDEGEISFLEWTMHMHNAALIKMNYLESLRLYNQAVINLQYLQGKI